MVVLKACSLCSGCRTPSKREKTELPEFRFPFCSLAERLVLCACGVSYQNRVSSPASLRWGRSILCTSPNLKSPSYSSHALAYGQTCTGLSRMRLRAPGKPLRFFPLNGLRIMRWLVLTRGLATGTRRNPTPLTPDVCPWSEDQNQGRLTSLASKRKVNARSRVPGGDQQIARAGFSPLAASHFLGSESGLRGVRGVCSRTGLRTLANPDHDHFILFVTSSR